MTAPLQTPGRPLGRARVRVIPTLLIDGQGRLVKTVKFGKRTYLGDPVNAVRIFNDKQVDELILLDIDATREGRGPDLDRIAGIAAEAFMPVAYGGGIAHGDQIAALFRAGIEKVVLSSALRAGTGLVTETARRYGAQAVTACLPVGRGLFGGTSVRLVQGREKLAGTPEDLARQAAEAGAGEILAYAIDRDGTWDGYDLPLLQRIAAAVPVPVVACGGAGGLPDLVAAIRQGGCSAVAAGSLFVYQARNKGVLISYPAPELLDTAFAAADTPMRPE